ncbi:GCN5-related N-acetyltransferase [Cellulophaga algicola DSM 14237]|uniref:GCN5-related N-acetyltransferase n=1 Tax=Cellulophaga algicola (strain DSM 14237 / IC166 / ACAM 630) TaxID=688270 RepID=E6XFC2_CELAD|nr:GNAT family N-acetyltransferase [Cellulophaga algicola]ADV51395.1 GCN5-related N-acetyltransferase [Cellulophaga algicola DSM 14237]
MSVKFSTDKSKLDLDKIQQYISNESYWGEGRTLEEVKITIDNSFCFGLYTENGAQIAFSRVVTDHILFAYLMDVIVFTEFQGKGYGKQLVEYIMTNELLKKVKTIALKTKDAHSLYERYGFKKVGDSEFWMSIDKIKL